MNSDRLHDLNTDPTCATNIWSLTAILQKSKELIIHIHISWFKTDFAVKNAMKTNTLK